MQMKDLSGILLLSLLMFAGIYMITILVDSIILQLVLGAFSGILFYLGMIFVFKFEEVNYIKSVVKR